MDIRRYKVGVIMGGVSAEREVSLKSGEAVCRALRELDVNHVAIDADKRVCERLKKENMDIAFIALHGGWGEDGALQGMLGIMEIPFTGSGVLASSLAMNKEASKIIFLHHGLHVPPFSVIERQTEEVMGIHLPENFAPPLFVKPSSEGSSVGVTFVKDKQQLTDAVKEALKYGDKVIVEQYIKGKEVQIGILAGQMLGGVEVRPSDEFYSYRAKYTAGATEYILPPEIDKGTYEQAGEIALKAHRSLGCRGATRVDLIIDDSHKVYVLEVNTIPGMTETSLLPKIAFLSGYDFKGLIKEIILDSMRNRRS